MTRQSISGLSALLLALTASGCCHNVCGTGNGFLSGRLDNCELESLCSSCGGGKCGGGKGSSGGWEQYTLTAHAQKLFSHCKSTLGPCDSGCGSCSGCGERYWGEWHSDPPDKVDPCDNCGNWIGRRPHNGPWWKRLRWTGHGKYGGGCGGACSHGSGLHGSDPHSGDIMLEGVPRSGVEIMEGPEELQRPAPREARQPTPASRTDSEVSVMTRRASYERPKPKHSIAKKR